MPLRPLQPLRFFVMQRSVQTDPAATP